MRTTLTYVAAVPDDCWGSNTLPLADQPVWSVFEQVIKTGPGFGYISQRVVSAGLTLHRAHEVAVRSCAAFARAETASDRAAVFEPAVWDAATGGGYRGEISDLPQQSRMEVR